MAARALSALLAARSQYLGCKYYQSPINRRRGVVLALLTEDGGLALQVTAESAQAIADTLSAAAEEMRKAG